MIDKILIRTAVRNICREYLSKLHVAADLVPTLINYTPWTKLAMSSAYERMVIQANEVPFQWRLGASAASWTVLAGFFIFPGTFTSLKQSEILKYSHEGRDIHNAVQNILLLPFASFCYLVGVIGLGYLWSRYRNNYFWLLSNIFLYERSLPASQGLTRVLTQTDQTCSTA